MSKPIDNLELRHLGNLEIREGEGGAVTVGGYAVVYGSESVDLGGFTEIMSAGCFTEALASNPDIRLLIEHCDLPLARTGSGTLKITEDEKGLRFDASLDTTDPDVQRILPKLRRGDVGNMSFGFYTEEDRWTEVGGKILRSVLKAGIAEISIVGNPAYPSTSVALRSKEKALAPKDTGTNVLLARLTLTTL